MFNIRCVFHVVFQRSFMDGLCYLTNYFLFSFLIWIDVKRDREQIFEDLCTQKGNKRWWKFVRYTDRNSLHFFRLRRGNGQLSASALHENCTLFSCYSTPNIVFSSIAIWVMFCYKATFDFHNHPYLKLSVSTGLKFSRFSAPIVRIRENYGKSCFH